MFGLGMPELIVILVIIVIVFGAGKISKLGGDLGKGIRNFKKAMKEGDEEAEEEDRRQEVGSDPSGRSMGRRTLRPAGFSNARILKSTKKESPVMQPGCPVL